MFPLSSIGYRLSPLPCLYDDFTIFKIQCQPPISTKNGQICMIWPSHLTKLFSYANAAAARKQRGRSIWIGLFALVYFSVIWVVFMLPQRLMQQHVDRLTKALPPCLGVALHQGQQVRRNSYCVTGASGCADGLAACAWVWCAGGSATPALSFGHQFFTYSDSMNSRSVSMLSCSLSHSGDE